VEPLERGNQVEDPKRPAQKEFSYGKEGKSPCAGDRSQGGADRLAREGGVSGGGKGNGPNRLFEKENLPGSGMSLTRTAFSSRLTTKQSGSPGKVSGGFSRGARAGGRSWGTRG